MNVIDNITVAIWQLIAIIAISGGAAAGTVIGYRIMRVHGSMKLDYIGGGLFGALIGMGVAAIVVLLLIH